MGSSRQHEAHPATLHHTTYIPLLAAMASTQHRQLLLDQLFDACRAGDEARVMAITTRPGFVMEGSAELPHLRSRESVAMAAAVCANATILHAVLAAGA